MEVTIANRCANSFSVAELKKGRDEFKKSVKFFTSSNKEAMTLSKVELVHIMGGPNPEEKRSASFKDTIRRCLTLKELQGKRYRFDDLDLPGMRDHLLENGSFNS